MGSVRLPCSASIGMIVAVVPFGAGGLVADEAVDRVVEVVEVVEEGAPEVAGWRPAVLRDLHAERRAGIASSSPTVKL